eukprot:NODE_4158_length_852_cov_321.212951_g3836_i0.p1 GENE.NODE_4158_length_852_cov_321.212951_g3836_i0~~NODE_4158_length_852_cov_321.212951_g3836_i0.p1  ORF type:complete len:141 (-),score=27.81 NODE_4158_length_852_cov_321.212951_g3836_i0:71-493(-)
MHGLNQLVNQYSHRGFVVVGFACNQFGLQMPGSSEEILNTFHYVRPGNGYTANFTVLETVNINGPKEDAVFQHLKSVCPFNGDTVLVNATNPVVWSPVRATDFVWNFEKVLIGRDGRAVARYHPYYSDPSLLASDIAALL